MKKNLAEHWNEKWPEIVGIATFTLSLVLLSFLDIGRDVVEETASLCAQLLGTYLGLALSTFAIYHGMNLRETYSALAQKKNLDENLVKQIHEDLTEIGKSFVFTILLIAVGTSTSFVTYFLSLLAKNNGIFNSSHPSFWNSLILSTMLAFVVTSTLNVVETVRTVLILRD